MSKVSIHIVSWNSLKFIPECLKSVFGQSFKDFSVLIIDNASDDNTVAFIAENYPQVKIIKNSKNLGFARAHNQGIITTDSEYILFLNPDIILKLDFLEKLMEVAKTDATSGAFGGKLLKIQTSDAEIGERQRTKVIDSVGLKIYKSRRVIDQGEGDEDVGQYERRRDVFGISGACALYRRKALEDIKIPVKTNGTSDEYFDEDFGNYKEDIDLAWRLRLRGWRAVYVPEAIAYHFRGAPIRKRMGQFSLVAFLSYRNHLWMLLKDDQWQNFSLHIWFIFWYQLGKELYLLFTQPTVLLGASFSYWRKFFKMCGKRRYIMSRATEKAKDIRKKFAHKAPFNLWSLWMTTD